MSLPDPSPIIDLAVMYRWSMVLFAASDLEVFTRLAERPMTAAEIAAACAAGAGQNYSNL